VGGEDGAGDREREHRPEALRHVVDPGGLAHVLRADRVQHDGGHGGKSHRDADAGDQQRYVQLDPAGGERAARGNPDEAERLQREPGEHDRPAPDPVGHGAGERRDEHRRGEERQQAQAGAER
jgi:hypothetical protein